MEKMPKKLELSRETTRELSDDQMDKIAGGYTYPGGVTCYNLECYEEATNGPECTIQTIDFVIGCL